MKGKRFPALCGDGKVRSAVILSLRKIPTWAAVQVTIDGKRRTIPGYLLEGAGKTILPPGVSHRFLSNRLTALVGFTSHKPAAPDLRNLSARVHGTSRPGGDELADLAFLTAAALYQIHAYTLDGYNPGAGNGEPLSSGDWEGWQRDAVRKLSENKLIRLHRLSWRAYKMREGRCG